MATLAPYTFFQEFDNNGLPLNGGKVFTYEAGTTTPKDTYTDSSGSIANTNPIILDSSGRADIWLGDGGYKFVLKTSADVTIKTVDNVGGTNSTAFGSDVQILTTNTTVNSTFANAVLVCTSALTLSLLASADAGEGFYVSVRNSSSGNVTIDPDTSELIDGASTLTIRAGFSALIICTGTAWRSVFSFPNNAIGFNDLNSTAISGQAPVTVAAGDKFLFGDSSNSDALAKGTFSDVVNLSTFRNAIDGFQGSTAGASTTLTIGAGQCADSTNTLYLTLASSIAKTTASWVVGAGGGLDTGSIANNTTYHFYAIRRPDTGVVDVVFSTNASTPTLPTNYTQFRRIFSWITNGSGQWRTIIQRGDNFKYSIPLISTLNTTNPGTAAITATLDTPVGVVTDADVTYLIRNTTVNTYGLISSLDMTDSAPDGTSLFNGVGATTDGSGTANTFTVKTNTSAQVRARHSASDANTIARLVTNGWIDTRGQE